MSTAKSNHYPLYHQALDNASQCQEKMHHIDDDLEKIFLHFHGIPLHLCFISFFPERTDLLNSSCRCLSPSAKNQNGK